VSVFDPVVVNEWITHPAFVTIESPPASMNVAAAVVLLVLVVDVLVVVLVVLVDVVLVPSVLVSVDVVLVVVVDVLLVLDVVVLSVVVVSPVMRTNAYFRCPPSSPPALRAYNGVCAACALTAHAMTRMTTRRVIMGSPAGSGTRSCRPRT